MNYLELAQTHAAYVDPESVGGYDGRIAAIATIMEVLTFGLFLSFGGVAIKAAVVKARDTRLWEQIANAVSRGRSAPPTAGSNEEALRLHGVEVDAGESFDSIRQRNYRHRRARRRTRMSYWWITCPLRRRSARASRALGRRPCLPRGRAGSCSHPPPRTCQQGSPRSTRCRWSST